MCEFGISSKAIRLKFEPRAKKGVYIPFSFVPDQLVSDRYWTLNLILSEVFIWPQPYCRYFFFKFLDTSIPFWISHKTLVYMRRIKDGYLKMTFFLSNLTFKLRINLTILEDWLRCNSKFSLQHFSNLNSTLITSYIKCFTLLFAKLSYLLRLSDWKCNTFLAINTYEVHGRSLYLFLPLFSILSSLITYIENLCMYD